MDRLLFIVINELALIIIMYVAMYIVLSGAMMDLYSRSNFFQFDQTFYVLGVHYEDYGYKSFLTVFFFANAFLAGVSASFVANMYRRLVFADPGDKVPPKRTTFALKTLFNFLMINKLFFGILGMLANVTFLLATVTGMFISQLISDYIQIYHPSLTKYGYELNCHKNIKRPDYHPETVENEVPDDNRIPLLKHNKKVISTSSRIQRRQPRANPRRHHYLGPLDINTFDIDDC